MYISGRLFGDHRCTKRAEYLANKANGRISFGEVKFRSSVLPPRVPLWTTFAEEIVARGARSDGVRPLFADCRLDFPGEIVPEGRLRG